MLERRRLPPLVIAAEPLDQRAGGRCLALCDGGRTLVSRDGGATFTAPELGPTLAVAFAGDEADAPLLAVCAAGGDAFLVEAREPSAAHLAELQGVIGPDAAVAIGWDATREVAWIACRAGLLALGSARRH